MNVIEMAREAFIDREPPYVAVEYREPWNSCTDEELIRFAALVRAQALEDAARTAEQYCGAWDDEGHTLAAAIRSLKDRQ